MAEQLIFDLASRPALHADNYFVSKSNASAVELLDKWPDWPEPSLIVCGSESCGKSHFINVWRKVSGARKIQASEIDEPLIDSLSGCQNLAIEDIDRNIKDETALFHLLNLTKEKNNRLILTTRKMPGDFHPTLPDLRSRLRSLPVFTIEQPDEHLLKTILLKLFDDRQINIEPDVLNYIFTHIDRSMSSIMAFVQQLDHASMTSQKKITKHFARKIINMS